VVPLLVAGPALIVVGTVVGLVLLVGANDEATLTVVPAMTPAPTIGGATGAEGEARWLDRGSAAQGATVQLRY
jgi:hypothetical protein